jgi:hypothetical protein
MCEILVRVRSKSSDDPVLDCKLTKRGDVIVARPDGWAWGAQELANPDWRIIRLPAVPLDEAEAMLAPEPETDPQNPSRMLQRRAFRLDLDSLPQPVRDWLADDSRQQPALAAGVTADQFRALKRRKPAVPDPAVIGESRSIIG